MSRVKAVATLVGVFGALGAGCTITTGGGTGTGGEATTGSISLQWTFNGGESCIAANVQQVQVGIAGQTVTFPCYGGGWSNGGSEGTIAGLSPGAYPFTVTGLTYGVNSSYAVNTAVATYQASGSISVIAGSDDSQTIDLPMVAAPAQTSTNIILLWTFSGQNCSQAGEPTVTIHITDPVNGDVDQPVACDQNNSDGVEIGADPATGQVGFSAGSYPVSLTASDASGDYYFASGTIYANGISDSVVHVDLQPQTTVVRPRRGQAASRST